MTALSWILCIATFLGGLAAQTDLARALAGPIASGLFLASFLACPLFWKSAPFADLLDGRQRLMACVALLLALPLVLIPAG